MSQSRHPLFHTSTLGLLGLACVLALPPGASAGDELEAGFQDPPVTARPRGMWVWPNGIASPSRITYELEEFKAKGMGGVEIWDVEMHVDTENVVPDGPRFMEGESLDAIGHAVREGKRLGLEIGLNVTNSYADERYGAVGLHRSTFEVEGPRPLDARLPFPKIEQRHKHWPPLLERDEAGRPALHETVAVLAMPRHDADTPVARDAVIDLTDRVDEDGRLTWQAPAGAWRIVWYVAAPTGEAGLFVRENAMGRTHDFFSAEATEQNLAWFLEPLERELGPLNETALRYCFMESYELEDALWTWDFPRMFRDRNGYDVVPYLPALDGTVVGSAEITERFLYDYRRTLSDLAVKNHFRKADDLLRERGLGYTAEAGGPGPPVHEIPFADVAALGAVSTPRGEFWNREPAERRNQSQVIKGPASAAHLYDRPIVEAESFTSVWLWQEGPNDLKPLADRAFAEGLNRIVYHVTPHTPWESGEPGWVYPFGSLTYPGRAWWPQSKPWHAYLGRLGFMLQQGRFVGDALYYYGDQAPNFVGHKQIPEDLGFGYDYDVTNSETIVDRLTVRDGRLTLPHGQTYEILVLPDQTAMNPDVLRRIEELVAAGATVVGPKPTRSHSLRDHERRDAAVREIAARLWGDLDGARLRQRRHGRGTVVWGKTPRQVLRDRDVGPDVAVREVERPPLDFIHRRTNAADIYFVRNASAEPLRLDVAFRVTGQAPEEWDPTTGRIAPLPLFEETDNGVRVPLEFAARGSRLIVFRDAAAGGDAESFVAVARRGATGDDRPAVEARDGRLVAFLPGDYTLRSANGGSREITVPALPEPRAIEGPWQVRFPAGQGVPGRVAFPELVSWTESDDEAIRHFSGTASYHTTFSVPPDALKARTVVTLDLGEVREVAQVWLNGRPLGAAWHAPYEVDLTEAIRPGENRLVVEVTNLLNNRLVGDARRPAADRRTHSNITKLPNAWRTPWAQADLLPSGLLGPVRIRFEHDLAANLDQERTP